MKDTYAIEHVAGYAENKILVEIRTIVISLYA